MNEDALWGKKPFQSFVQEGFLKYNMACFALNEMKRNPLRRCL